MQTAIRPMFIIFGPVKMLILLLLIVVLILIPLIQEIMAIAIMVLVVMLQTPCLGIALAMLKPNCMATMEGLAPLIKNAFFYVGSKKRPCETRLNTGAVFASNFSLQFVAFDSFQSALYVCPDLPGPYWFW